LFLGHFAVALAAKPRIPRVSLGWLFAATQLPDLLWPPLLLLGLEHVRIAPGDTAFTPLAFESYPWSHSLLTVAVHGVVFGGLYRMTSGRALTEVQSPDTRGAVMLSAVVVSHWILDALTHRPDLPLVPHGDTLIGFGLWRSVPLTLAVELAMFTAGIWLYLRGRAARSRSGLTAFWILVAFLGVIYAANAFGPPPPSGTVIAYAGLGLWLFVGMAWWADR
jgi:hypothetical protein